MNDLRSAPDPVARATLAIASLVALATAGTGWHPVYEVDAFFQMQLGRAVLEHGSRLVPEPSAISAFTEPCLAFEWLWGWLLLGVVGVAGPAGLTWLSVGLAFAAVAICFVWLRGKLARYPLALVALTCISALVISARVKARPQVLFMLLLPGAFWLIERTLRGAKRDTVPGAPPARSAFARDPFAGFALCVGAVLWAQLHGSFILLPGIFGALALQDYLDRGFSRERLRADGLILLGLCLALLTSAAGLDVVGYVLAHGGGDAAAHIREMAPTKFGELSPFDSPHHAALFVTWVLAVCGLRSQGRFRVGELLLALLGVVLLSRAARFTAAAALLALPLATWGARNLAACVELPAVKRLRTALAALLVGLTLLALGSVARLQARTRGPLAHAGWTAGAHPRAALRALDPGTGTIEVLTDYRAGPALAFWSEGRIRHYVDGRTPQYFDDTDYAVQREIFSSEQALLRGLLRYQPEAAVVRRTGSCAGFARHWSLVAVDATYSTFVPPGSAERFGGTLEGIEPCGPLYLEASACEIEPARMASSLARLDAHSEPALAAHIRAAHALRCARDPGPALALSAGADTWGHRAALRRLQAEAAVWAGAADRARALIDDGLAEEDASVVQLLPPVFPAVVGEGFARDALQRAIAIMDDDAPAGLRAQLARLCAKLGDLECARFQGLRAAAQGRIEVLPVLRVLAEAHPRAQVREDARRWMQVLQVERSPEP